MPVLSLPLTFNNSFWSQDYRRGLETVYAKLNQGIEEDAEVVEFIRSRARVERDLAQALMASHPTGSHGTGMDRDDGASLLVAFRGLQAESMKQGEAHLSIANELENLVADPFESWADRHAARIADSKALLLDGFLGTYEEAVSDVSRLKETYFNKARKADEAEDDARFVGLDGYTTPPSPRPPPRRGDSLGDRIASSLGFGAGPGPLRSPPIIIHEPDSLSDAGTVTQEDPTPTKKPDKGKGKEIPAPLEPVGPASHIVTLADTPFPAKTIPELLTRAKAELPLRPVRIPFLGEYEETFTGEDFVTWLKNNVPGFAGSLDRAEQAARELTERDGLLRRVGEFGNKFENHPAATFQFRPKAFETPETTPEEGVMSPVVIESANTLLKRSNTVASYLARSLKASNEPPHRKARIVADEANERYRSAVAKLDGQRLALEDRIESMLKQWYIWELDRLRAVKTVLLQYEGTIANLPKAMTPSLERSSTLLASFQPESDLNVAIERYRTGPFRPKAHVYESVRHERADTVFGIDLRQWAGEGGWHAVRAGSVEPHRDDAIPWVVRGLLAGLTEGYKRLPNDVERRKAWVYDVPLPAQHQLREALNAIPIDKPVPLEMLAKHDPPVIASALKLWLLELDPPLGTWEGWEEIRKLYPNVGADKARDGSVVDDLRLALRRLPKVHLLVLDAIVKHLKDLVDATPGATEPREVYITKLALSIGRCILRPEIETQMSIQDRHHTVFFVDLMNNYEQVLPVAIAHKKRDSGQRAMPTRKPTAPVDMRLHRSRLSQNIDPQELLAVQKELQTGMPMHRSSSPSPGDRTPRRLSLVDSQFQRQQQEAAAAATATAPAPAPALAPVALALAQPPPPQQQQQHQQHKTDGGLPPRPTFVEPPPETDDDSSVGLTNSVIVIAPSQVAAPPDPAPAPPPPVLAPFQQQPEHVVTDAPRSEPVKKAVKATPAAPLPSPPATSPSPPSQTPRSPTSPPTSGRNTPTSNRPGRRASSPPSRTPSVSSSLRRESSASSTGATATRPGGPRIVRGPRVAHRPTPSAGTAVGTGGAGGAGPKPSSMASPGLKRRPLSGIGFTPRTMASGSEDEMVGKSE